MEHKEFIVHDRVGAVSIIGTLLSDQRFGSETKPRWTDMALYRIIETRRSHSRTVRGAAPGQPLFVEEDKREKPFRYALEIIARSWVYHDATGRCVKERHTVTTVGEARQSPGRWRQLYPCTVCNPPDLEKMDAGDRIAEENEELHLYLCSDASAVVKRLYRHSGEISVLAAKLLSESASKDRPLALALRRPRRI